MFVQAEPQAARLKTMIKTGEAWLANLNEERLEKLALDQDGTATMAVAGKKIVTVALVPAAENAGAKLPFFS